ncbi:anti-anti-sigma factor [Streptomyces sp. SAI-133]|jgi:stage II sporulation protein AA (anti-sigma F factor antagonist)|uniref:STAS domain-containing protein n=1 Tax=unclassified Streptomyces TaxID=2593676 RepID=UPI002476017A|nr:MULTISPECIES: STAS domain-containing protein [unclassified Streptomyces]MDH6554215.1 anti-anti-sigma factor [Streptomyces sp. SAI-041]MDH6581787.1 anti-anti-sigma factor [Streptomyces sp. SAI-133]
MTGDKMPDTEQDPPPGHLAITETTSEGIRILTLAGEIDYDTCGTLRQALTIPVPQPPVVIDLRRVTFMDSTGINILIAAHHNATAAGGWLRLAAPTNSVMRTIQIVGLDTVIDCHPTLHEALSA